MPDNRKLFVVLGALSAVLLLLIIITSFLSAYPSSGNTPTTQITPIPRTRTGSTVIPTTTPIPRRDFDKQLSNLVNEASNASQSAQLQTLKSRLPYSSDAFDMGYSPILNEFFVNEKTDEADEAFNDFLTQNGAFDILANNPGLITRAPRRPVGQQIQQAEDQLVNLLEESTEHEPETSSASEEGYTYPLTQQVKDTKLLFDFVSGFVNIDFGSPGSSTAATTTAGGGGALPTSSNAQDLLANPRLELTQRARQDLAAGIIDQRLVNLIGTMLQNHTISITVLKTGHNRYVRGTNRESNHYHGRGADIFKVDGAIVRSNNAAAYNLSKSLIDLPAGLRPSEVGQPWGRLAPGFFTDGDHKDHIHIGFR